MDRVSVKVKGSTLSNPLIHSQRKLKPREVKRLVKVTQLVDGRAEAESRRSDPRTLALCVSVSPCQKEP